MQVNIHGAPVEINDAQVDIVRTEIQTINGEKFLSARVVDDMLKAEATNALLAGDVQSVMTLAKVAEAFVQFLALADQV